MNDEALQSALDFCIANPEGLSTENLLTKFPEYRDQLGPLLALCGLINDIPTVPAERRDAMKGRLMAAAAAAGRQTSMQPLQAGTATGNGTVNAAVRSLPAAIDRSDVTDKKREPISILGWLKRPAVALVAAALILFAFTWSASASALPDSPFYNVRLLAENVQVNFAGSPLKQALEHVTLADARLLDIAQMNRENKLDKAGPAFVNYDDHLGQVQSLLNGNLPATDKTNVATALYRTCTKGKIEFSNLDSNPATLSAPIKTDLNQASQQQDTARSNSAVVLTANNISPYTVLSPDVQQTLQNTPGPESTAIAQSRITPQPSTTSSNTQGQPGSTQTAAAQATSVAHSSTTAASSDTAVAVGTGQVVGAASTTAVSIAGSSSPSATPQRTGFSTQQASPQATSSVTIAQSPTATVAPGQTGTPGTPSATNTPGTATPQLTRTATGSATAHTTVQAGSTPTPAPSTTPTPTPAAARSATPTSTSTRRASTNVPAATPPRAATSTRTTIPTPTSTRTATSAPTFTRTPTYTAVPIRPSQTPTATYSEPAATKDSKPTREPQPTKEPKPNSTPPSTPPEPPTHAVLPTHAAPPTHEAPPTATDKPPKPTTEPDGNACEIELKGVEVSCGTSTCVNYNAGVKNDSQDAAEVNWTVQLSL